jgi:Cu+-exporting ATPase
MKNLFILLLVVILAACQSGNKNGQEKQATGQTQTAQATINISGMHCENCVASVEKGIKELDGIVTVAVSLNDSNAVVLFDPAKVDIEKIGKTIEGRGYTVKK